MKELSEAEVKRRLSDVMDELNTLFPIIMRKVLFDTVMKTKIPSSDMQTLLLEGLVTGEMNPSEISKVYCISRPNVTTLVDKLINKGYAQRVHDDKDRRAIIIRITDKGRRLMAKRHRIMKEYVFNALARLDHQELVDICESLEGQRKFLNRLNNIL